MTIEKQATGCEDGGQIVRTRECLLSVLATVDDEGWDGVAGTRLLVFIRTDLVWPLVAGWGLRGFAASQAEASAWQAAWRVLTTPQLREAESPWGVVWKAASRAVHGEAASSLFGKCERRSWQLLAGRDGDAAAQLESLDKWSDMGLDAVSDDYLAEGVDFTRAQVTAAAALAAAGWRRDQADDIVATTIQLQALPRDRRCTFVGWRTMAEDLGLPAWQARRLCVVLLGTPDWPGLLPRLLLAGPGALRTPGMGAALRSTRTRRHRSPVLAAKRAGSPAATYPQRAAG